MYFIFNHIFSAATNETRKKPNRFAFHWIEHAKMNPGLKTKRIRSTMNKNKEWAPLCATMM